MAVKKVRCWCDGNPACKLCGGTKFYPYEPGPRGWMPFPCPTCAGTGDGGKCVTCKGERQVDPANPPPNGWLDVFWKAIFGA